MTRTQYLQSKRMRGRWFHYYRRDGRYVPLGVNGLAPNAPAVIAAYEAAHRRWEEKGHEAPAPQSGTLAALVDLFRETETFKGWSADTQANRAAIMAQYRKSDPDWPVHDIGPDDIDAALAGKSAHAKNNHVKALRPMFAFAVEIGWMSRNPTAHRGKAKASGGGFPTAEAAEIQAFQDRWDVGTRERLVFDLAILTGAARTDLAGLGPHNVRGDLLIYTRNKTGQEAAIPMNRDLRAVIERAAEMRGVVAMKRDLPFILSDKREGYTKESLGAFFAAAAAEAGWPPRMGLHALRKAFCVYWAERGVGAKQLAAMAGHKTLDEVQRYSDAADRFKLVRLLVEV